jgi:hypothetical protein
MTTVCSLTACEQQFATRILTDLGLCKNKVDEIVAKLCVSSNVFQAEKSKTTLDIIASNLYECLKPTANDIARITADELSKTFIYILIITAIFIVLIATLLVILSNPIYYIWVIIISFIFALLYIGLVFFLAYIAKNNISNSITNSQNAASNCVATAVTALTNYENDNQNALDDALCAYTDTPVVC